jgi:5'-methylthioadenosine phosphorylase
MGRMALVGGHTILGTGFAADATRLEVRGVTFLEVGDVLVLQRHGLDTFTPAHRLDHEAHVRALEAAGCDRILGLASVGSLRADWPVGSVVAPDDFYAPNVNLTLHEDAKGHAVHEVHHGWRAVVLDTWRSVSSTAVEDGGVYAQNPGPRFETPAEVRALARVADLVGMTMASEIIMASEVRLAYAGLCVVDNLANGIGEHHLTEAEFRAGVAANTERVLTDLDALLPVLAAAEVAWDAP